MIDNLIIIIPTHNRQNYLRRVVKYYSSFPCKVFICDSSKEKALIECSDNLTYRWVPQSNFYGKVLDVLTETSADFYALSPDDDFLKLETLMECYNNLVGNSEYVMANGRQYLFHKNFDNCFYYNPVANGFSGVQNISNDLDGISFFWKNYQNMLWSLFRREAILNAFSVLAKCCFNNGNFVELVLSIESLKIGSAYISNNPFNFMEINPNEHWGNTTPSISLESYFKSSDLRKDIKSFYEVYNEDSIAKKCLKMHMGNPFKELCRFVYSKCRMLLLIIQGDNQRTKDTIINFPQVEDKEMIQRIAISYQEMK